MAYYNDELRNLQQQTARKQQLNRQLAALQQRQPALAQKAAELQQLSEKEQTDVDKLEGGSLAAFFYNVVGKMDEKLDKERQEAYAARVRYDAAARELNDVEDAIRRATAELQQLGDCECRYAKLLDKKSDALKAAGGDAALQIFALEQKLGECLARQKELREAIEAGQRALCTAEQVRGHLDSADGYATWDLLGGGLLADVAKHDHLDQAQNEINYLQAQLGRFRTELADVTIHANLQVSIDGFMRFADYFFDGLFADWTVKDKIGQALQQVQGTIYEIRDVLSRLDNLLRSAKSEQDTLQARLDSLVLEADL